MRVVLDECINEKLRHAFVGHECQTCSYAGLKGLSNGKLLTAVEKAGFQILITVDRSMHYQQNMRGRGLALVVLEGLTTSLDGLLSLMPDVLAALDLVKPGQVLRIGGSAH